jgi:hypothetical protein
MTLYHYTSGQGLFGIINSDELQCSNINFLNDPSEKSYFQDLCKLVFKESSECEQIFSTLFNDSFQKAVVNPFETFIASFSKNEDSLSMWNYYAKGNGYNIGLDIDKIIEENKDANLAIQKIDLVYDHEKQVMDTLNFIQSYKQSAEKYKEYDEKLKVVENEDDYHEYSLEQNYLIEEFNYGIYELGLGFKHKAYEREQEVRLIISEDEMEQRTTKFKVSENGVFVEYIPLRLNLKSNLKSITIHPLNGQLHFEGIKKFISFQSLSKETEIKVSNIPFRMV